MYTDDEKDQMQAKQKVPILLHDGDPDTDVGDINHHLQYHWINNHIVTTTPTPTDYSSPVPLNISSIYSSSSPLSATDPIIPIHHHVKSNPFIMLDNQQNTLVSNTDSLNTPFHQQYICDEIDDYSSLYTFRSCFCESQTEQCLNNEYDFQNYQISNNLNGFSFYKTCNCTSDYAPVCETHSVDTGEKKFNKKTKDYLTELSNEMKFPSYPEYMIPEENSQNFSAFQKDETESAQFDISYYLSCNSTTNNPYKTTPYEWISESQVTLSGNEILSKTYKHKDHSLTDHEIQLSDPNEPGTGSVFPSSNSSSSTSLMSFSNRHNDIRVCRQKFSEKSFQTKISDSSLSEKSSSLLDNHCRNTEGNNNGAIMAAASAALANLHHRGSLQLWQFLIALLDDKESQHLICWTGRTLEFKLNDPEEVARLWGIQKNRPAMNYDKLSRSLRYYYEKGIMQKVSGERYVYRFVYEPELLFSLAFPGEEQSSQSLPTTSTRTTATTATPTTMNKINTESKLHDHLNNQTVMNTSKACYYPTLSDYCNKPPKDNSSDDKLNYEGKFPVKRRYTDFMEGNKTKCINSAAHNTTTTTGHIDNSNNNNNYNYYVDSSYIHGYDNTVSNNLDNAQKNISNENGIMPYEMSNNHNNNNNDNNNHCGDQDFLVISSSTTTDGNNHIRVENADDPNCHRTEQHLLETDFLAYTNECLMHTSWLDNFPGEQEHPTTDFQQNINHQYFTNHLYNFSSDSYNAGQQSLLQPSSSSSSSIVCGRNDIWFDQKEFTCLPDETLKTEVYSREQERLSSSSSSPPSSSSFTLLLSDRSVLSTPPPITVNLQNIYEMNYELLVNSDKLSHRTF